ncbi:MAG: endonuclease III [Planctomycetota bacterium]
MPRESKANKRKRAVEINDRLAKEYPGAECSLDYENPFQLLVATILAAQCTDARVNMVTPDLFEAFDSPRAFAAADREDIEQAVRSCGFYRNKARSIQGAASRIVEEHDGEVPDTMDELLDLPGVARKTANVILGTAFGKNEGIVVDTHVTRLAGRLKLTTRKNNQGDKIEKDLQDLLPREEWTMFAHRLVFHGRQCCTARTPDCDNCCLNDLCPSAGKV